jgi:hypothetical protein
MIQVDGKLYTVTGHAREGRFGMEDPKFWVKRVIDRETGPQAHGRLSVFSRPCP